MPKTVMSVLLPIHISSYKINASFIQETLSLGSNFTPRLLEFYKVKREFKASSR